MDDFEKWVVELEAQHLSDLRFSEVSRALRALSSTYVERRSRIGDGAALSGAGKRAAFALFYGPLHFVLVREIASQLGVTGRGPDTVVDLGCGTGAGGAAWSAACGRSVHVVGIDRHPWAVREAAKTYRTFGLPAKTIEADVARARLPKSRATFLAAFTLNELQDDARESLMETLLARAQGGDQLLVIEPLAGRVAPWWKRWQSRIEEVGGRADEWRFRLALPPIVEKLDRAAGLNHRELTGRSLWIAGSH